MGQQLGLPPEKVVVTIDRHANTSAASIPLALAEAAGDGRIKPGQLVLLEAMGGGFTWGVCAGPLVAVLLPMDCNDVRQAPGEPSAPGRPSVTSTRANIPL